MMCIQALSTKQIEVCLFLLFKEYDSKRWAIDEGPQRQWARFETVGHWKSRHFYAMASQLDSESQTGQKEGERTQTH